MKVVQHWSKIFYIAGFLVIGLPLNTAHAGFLDKLNAATQKINQASQNIQQKSQQIPKRPAAGQSVEDPDRPLHLDDHYKGSCYGIPGSS